MTYTIFQSSGQYLGFIREDGYILSRDGVYLGWLEGNFAWDKDGQFRGQLSKINENYYILKNMYSVSPVPKTPRPVPSVSTVPNPFPNIASIQLKIGFKDGF